MLNNDVIAAGAGTGAAAAVVTGGSVFILFGVSVCSHRARNTVDSSRGTDSHAV